MPNEEINVMFNNVGYDYFETFGIKIAEGRNFSKDFLSDAHEACIINETAVRIFGWEKPIGKRITLEDKEFVVVGVTKDFHPFSVFQKIPPSISYLQTENIDQGMMHTVRLTGGQDILATRQKINAVYKEFFPNTLFDFQFVGENLDDGTMSIYNGIVNTFLFFSLITILIAAVGMFGLVAFTTKSRTKEIGIRKVHGASTGQIFNLLAREFVVLIIIAVILSFPAGIGFKSIDPAAYKAETEIWEYLFTIGLVFIVTFFTISYHTRKASRQNPTESLRYE